MVKSRYDWKRFWCQPDGHINMSDDGFLVDPDTEYSAALNPDVVSWEQISTKASLILLGEPGTGKSTALLDEYDSAAASAPSTRDQALWVDLRSYQTDQRLHEHVFESATVKSWKEGRNRLHLFLDSMDEALLRIDNIASVLLTEFKDLPVSRLNVRIACRTADWPGDLESEFEQVWGKDAVGTYELAPLRRADVEKAAKEKDLDAASFLGEVLRCNAVPLAIKPVTLEFLLNIYKRNASFPLTRAELYAEGCRLLCEDTRQSRRPPKAGNELSADQRLKVASRIAGATILCNRNAIWTDVDRGDVPMEDIPIRDLLHTPEFGNGEPTGPGEHEIWQSLNTGLFSSRGSSRLGWSHQTYAEFLAARFVIEHKLTPNQIFSLILHEDGKVIPQLHEVAAWLASMVSDLFRLLMKKDAEFLLRSDAATADAKDRYDLVDNLLALFEEEQLLDFDWELRKRYQKLKHPRLAEQLEPYIGDNQKGVIVRRVAINIAEACTVQSLQSKLAQISLDQSEVHEIRSAAAFAVLQIGDGSAKKALRPLALGACGLDQDDDLKGCGLAASWPDFLSATELFEALTPEKQPHRYGMYSSFLRRDLAKQLNEPDLPVALKWAAERSGLLDPLNPLTAIADKIAAKALDHIDNVAVGHALAEVLSVWTGQAFHTRWPQESKLRTKLVDNPDARRRLLVNVLPLVGGSIDQFWYLYRGSLLVKDDFGWLISQLFDTSSHDDQRTIVGVIAKMFDYREPGHLDSVVEACKENQLLASEYNWLLTPVTLNSPQADAMKARWNEMNDLDLQPTRTLLNPPPEQRIATLLQKFEEGDLDAFWRLNLDLTLKPDSTYYSDEFQSEITALPGWTSADGATQGRIIAAAKQYVLKYQPTPPTEWIRTNTFPRVVLSGYRALLLLLGTGPRFIEELPKACWEKWAPISLAYPLIIGDGEFSPHHQLLLRLAYEHAPASVLSSLDALIDKENEQHGVLFVLGRIEPIWDGRLAANLLAKLDDRSLKPDAWGAILAELLSHEIPEARASAIYVLSVPIADAGERRERAIIAASALIRNAVDVGWAIVWPAVQHDKEFGLELFRRIAHLSEAFQASSVNRLTDDQLADLYIWLFKHVPYKENAIDTGFHAVSPSESLAHWRDSVLVQLKNRGTVRACDGIRRTIREFPEHTWLKWHLIEAEQMVRRHSWTPLAPQELFELAVSQGRRLVQNGVELLEVLAESLSRYQTELQGETPGAPALWDKITEGHYRPKDEMHLSNQVKLHFERDIRAKAIVVNREVQIRAAMGNRPGEQTDIHVDAVLQRSEGKYDQISAIVEVKGCWNKDLITAMQTQLTDRYLADNRCPFGLYLVGWFTCPQWDQADYRKSDTPKLTLEEAEKTFRDQAGELSSGAVHLKSFVLNAALR